VRATLAGLDPSPVVEVRLSRGTNRETRRRGTKLTIVVAMPRLRVRRLPVDQFDRRLFAWTALDWRRRLGAAMLAGGYRDRAQIARIAPVVEWAYTLRYPDGSRSTEADGPLQVATGKEPSPPPPGTRPASAADARVVRAGIAAFARQRGDHVLRLVVRRPYGLAVDLAVRPRDPRRAFCAATKAYSALLGSSGDIFAMHQDALDLTVLGGTRQQPWTLAVTTRVGEGSQSDPCVGEQGAIVAHLRPLVARSDTQCAAIARGLGQTTPTARGLCRGAHRRAWLALALGNHNRTDVPISCLVNGYDRRGRATFSDRALNPPTSSFGLIDARPGTTRLVWFLAGNEHRADHVTADCEILRSVPI
jgi:hypothetical protein